MGFFSITMENDTFPYTLTITPVRNKNLTNSKSQTHQKVENELMN